MDAPALEDRHPVLYPEERLIERELRQQKPCPAAIARMQAEQFRKGGAGRSRQMPWSARPAGERMNFGRTTFAASDQDKVCNHTTHNIFVLLLFFVS